MSSSREFTLAMRMQADSARYVAGLASAESRTRRFGGAVRREFDELRRSAAGITAQLGALGVTFGAVANIAPSAKLDKSLTQIGQTAGAGKDQVEQLRAELFRMAKETGQDIGDLEKGFNNAIQAGLRWDEALGVINATNAAMAVTGANADSLTGALSVMSTAWGINLAEEGKATELLEKMTVAGRLGNAELQDLAGIVSRVGTNAAAAGMDVNQFLAYVEGLSGIERQSDRLSTLADSTLRLFTNGQYMKQASRATGVKFFDADGSRRDAIAVFGDIKKQYDKLTTDAQRARFMRRAFSGMDQDTVKGLRALLGGDMLDKIGGEFIRGLKEAGGTFKTDLPEALDNSVDQVGRLRGALREAADGFVRPINAAITGAIKFGMDPKEKGGLGLDGKDMIVGGGALAIGTLLAARYGGKAISSLVGRGGNVATGVAAGKALEAAAGITPVFVTNWPEGGPASADVMGVAGKGRLLSAARGAGAVGLAAVGGYAAGTALYKGALEGNSAGDAIGAAIARTLAFFGNEDARRAVAMTEKLRETEIGGEIRIRLDQDGRASVQASTRNPRVPLNVDAGLTMMSAS